MEEDLTALLRAWAAGDQPARDRLFERVYPDLRRMAAGRLLRERADISVDATELVHEAFLRLKDQRLVDWESRTQFFALTSTLLRRILVDHAKRRRRDKRGAAAVHIPFDEAWAIGDRAGRTAGAGEKITVDLLDLDEALADLAAIRASAARIVELRFFTGLEIAETAECLGLSRATVIRRWRFARAWLTRRLEA